MKKFIALVLALVMVLSLATVAFAVEFDYEYDPFTDGNGRTAFVKYISGDITDAMKKHDEAIGNVIAACLNAVHDVVARLNSFMASDATIPFTNHHWKNNDYAQAFQSAVNEIVEDIKESGITEDLISAISWFFSFNGFRVTNAPV